MLADGEGVDADTGELVAESALELAPVLVVYLDVPRADNIAGGKLKADGGGAEQLLLLALTALDRVR